MPSVFLCRGSHLLSSVQRYNTTDTSWTPYLGQVPDLYSNALTNVIGTSIYERVYDWVHVEREHGILYNSTSFVVPIPLLPVDQHNIGTVLVPLPPTFPRFSLQTGCMLPRFVITLERPLLIFSSFVTQTGLCSTHLCSFAHQTRIHVAEYLHKLWIFVT